MTPPLVAIGVNALNERLAYFADGRVARQRDGQWEPIDHIDYATLWPTPAYADAPVADLPEPTPGPFAGVRQGRRRGDPK